MVYTPYMFLDYHMPGISQVYVGSVEKRTGMCLQYFRDLKPRKIEGKLKESCESWNCLLVPTTWKWVIPVSLYTIKLERPAAGHDNSTLATGYKFCTWQFTFKLINVQDAEYYVRSCNLLIFIISGSVWNFEAQNPLWKCRFRRICGTAYKW